MEIDIVFEGAAGSVRDWVHAKTLVGQRIDLSESQKDQVCGALDFFRVALGDAWQGWRQGWPLAHQFMLRYGTQAAEGATLAERLKRLSDIPGQDTLVRRLGEKAWERYLATRMELGFAAYAVNARRAVVIVEEESTATPDLEITVDSRAIAIECTRMLESANERRSDDLLNTIQTCAIDHGLTQQGRLEIRYADVDAKLAWKRADEVVRTVGALVAAGGGHISIAGLADLSLDLSALSLPFPITEMPLVDSYASVEEMLAARRVLLRIHDKVSQLRRGGPSLLVVQSRSLFFQSFDFDSVALDIARLSRERMLEMPEISAILIYEDVLSAEDVDEAVVKHRSEYSTVLERRGPRRRAAVLARNLEAAFPLSDDEIVFFINRDPRW